MSELQSRLREVECGKSQRRPGEDHQRPAGIGEKRFERLAAGIAMENRRDAGEHCRDDERDAESHLEREEVKREERRANESRVGAVLTRDDHRMPVTAEQLRLFVLGKRASERLLAILHLREQVLRQLADDVVLMAAGKKESNGL